MALTRSWTAAGAAPVMVRAVQSPSHGLSIWWLSGASLLVAAGLAMVYIAKLQRIPETQLLNLNTVTSQADLLPILEFFPDRAELAPELYKYLESARPLRNAGALSRIIPRRGLARMKAMIVVRSVDEFRRQLLLSSVLYFGGFFLVALVWRWKRFRGDQSFLPALQLLTGFGFLVMVSIRDPLRDTLEFQKFAIGVFCGCLLLALPAFRLFDYCRLTDWCYTPLLGAMALFGLLIVYGKGPAGTDVKVNVGPFQPVEPIKILLVLFLAGYFTRNWERLRDLRERRILRDRIPRLEHVLPVLGAVGVSLLLFFLLKDLGPALAVLFVFLAMFSVARGRPVLAIAAIVLMIGSVAAGYRLGQPQTVVQRINIWLSPWNNDVRGGDQIAHSLWAFATGGPTGSGPGYGDPSVIPAGHTDLVLAAIGEEWGFAGVSIVFLLSAFLINRGLVAARRAATTFGFFLGVGLSALIACEMLLITAGVLGALPLSGIVSPFLSSGNTAMLANFLVFAMLASVSCAEHPGRSDALAKSSSALKFSFAAAGLVLLAFAFRYQVLRERDYLARDVFAFQEDGVKRSLHNPRLNSLAREIPRGSIYDRNGITLATDTWSELEQHRATYAGLGVSLEGAVSRFDTRHYPFGAATAHLIGDRRTGENFFASNASLVEHDSNRRLQGYEYAELAPLIRYRYHPHNPGIAAILARDRNVRLTIDIRLQLRAREILERHLRQAGKPNGAVVVMEAVSGDVLAMVSAPAPDPPSERTAAASPEELLDRARYGQYPPGSTFKLVTAMAALFENPQTAHRKYVCRPLGSGRVGNFVRGWNRAINDDIHDHAHGAPDMEQGLMVSCNAYFAQVGVNDVGSKNLAKMAEELGISTGDAAELRKALPFAAYGQGPVLISPFKMARVAGTIAAGGRMAEGRWIGDESNPRTAPSRQILPLEQATFLAGAMRKVVTGGTARSVMAGATVQIAGKTGTAQLDDGLPHAWFTGFAPYDADAAHRLAFAVLVEHGGYGGRVAAPIARELMEAAKELGLL